MLSLSLQRLKLVFWSLDRSNSHHVAMDVLCSVCRAVFTGKGRKFNHKAFGKMRFYSHHRDIQALKKAASENCVLCGLLWRSLSTQEKEEIQDASPKSPATGMELASISYHIRRDPYESRSSRFRFRKPSGEFITKDFCFEQLRGMMSLSKR